MFTISNLKLGFFASFILFVFAGLYILISGNFGDVELKFAFTFALLTTYILLAFPWLLNKEDIAMKNQLIGNLVILGLGFLASFLFIWDVASLRSVHMEGMARILLFLYTVTMIHCHYLYLRRLTLHTSLMNGLKTFSTVLTYIIAAMMIYHMGFPLPADSFMTYVVALGGLVGLNALTMLIVSWQGDLTSTV